MHIHVYIHVHPCIHTCTYVCELKSPVVVCVCTKRPKPPGEAISRNRFWDFQCAHTAFDNGGWLRRWYDPAGRLLAVQFLFFSCVVRSVFACHTCKVCDRWFFRPNCTPQSSRVSSLRCTAAMQSLFVYSVVVFLLAAQAVLGSILLLLRLGWTGCCFTLWKETKKCANCSIFSSCTKSQPDADSRRRRWSWSSGWSGSQSWWTCTQVFHAPCGAGQSVVLSIRWAPIKRRKGIRELTGFLRLIDWLTDWLIDWLTGFTG